VTTSNQTTANIGVANITNAQLGTADVTSNTESSAVTEGALVVTGGLGVGQKVVTNLLTVKTTDQATSYSVAPALIEGGLGVSKKIIANDTITAPTFSCTSTNVATSTTVAPMTLAGGLGVAKNIKTLSGECTSTAISSNVSDVGSFYTAGDINVLNACVRDVVTCDGLTTRTNGIYNESIHALPVGNNITLGGTGTTTASATYPDDGNPLQFEASTGTASHEIEKICDNQGTTYWQSEANVYSIVNGNYTGVKSTSIYQTSDTTTSLLGEWVQLSGSYPIAIAYSNFYNASIANSTNTQPKLIYYVCTDDTSKPFTLIDTITTTNVAANTLYRVPAGSAVYSAKKPYKYHRWIIASIHGTVSPYTEIAGLYNQGYNMTDTGTFITTSPGFLKVNGNVNLMDVWVLVKNCM
jgi:hypothetical protein